jgi:hypothetical protein
MGQLPQNANIVLPVPGASLFEIAEKVHAPIEPLPLVAHQPERAPIAAYDDVSSAGSRTKHVSTSHHRHGRHAGHGTHQKSRVANAGRSASEHEIPLGAAGKKSAIRVAKR